MSQDRNDAIERLRRLLAAGVLSQDEFDQYLHELLVEEPQGLDPADTQPPPGGGAHQPGSQESASESTAEQRAEVEAIEADLAERRAALADAEQQEQDRQRAEAALAESLRLQAEEAERLEQERLQAEEADRRDLERLRAEEAERLEQERLQAEETERLEQERLQAEETERLEQERLQAEETPAVLPVSLSGEGRSGGPSSAARIPPRRALVLLGLVAAALVLIFLFARGDSEETTATQTEPAVAPTTTAVPTTTAPPTTTAVPTTTAAPRPACEVAEEVEFVVTDWEYRDADADLFDDLVGGDIDLTANFRITNPTPYPAKVLYALVAYHRSGVSLVEFLESSYPRVVETNGFDWSWSEADLVEVGAGESLVGTVTKRFWDISRDAAAGRLRVGFRLEQKGNYSASQFASEGVTRVESMFGEHDPGAEPYWLDIPAAINQSSAIVYQC